MTELPTYDIPEGASPEARKWIERAQSRLQYFAGKPEYRQAYELEILERMQHNTLMAERLEEGRAEGKAEGLAEGKAKGRSAMIKVSVVNMRKLGLSDQQIKLSLQLTLEETKLYLGE